MGRGREGGREGWGEGRRDMLRKKGGVEKDDGERIKARMENLCAVVVWLVGFLFG